MLKILAKFDNLESISFSSKHKYIGNNNKAITQYICKNADIELRSIPNFNFKNVGRTQPRPQVTVGGYKTMGARMAIYHVQHNSYQTRNAILPTNNARKE